MTPTQVLTAVHTVNENVLEGLRLTLDKLSHIQQSIEVVERKVDSIDLSSHIETKPLKRKPGRPRSIKPQEPLDTD